MSGGPALVWFDRDLRLADNPALQMAIARKMAIVPVFVWSPEEEEPWAPGSASRWWLHQSLVALADSLRERGSKLIVRHGRAADALSAVAAECGAGAVFWNRLLRAGCVGPQHSGFRRVSFRGPGILGVPGQSAFRARKHSDRLWKELSGVHSLLASVSYPRRTGSTNARSWSVGRSAGVACIRGNPGTGVRAED